MMRLYTLLEQRKLPDDDDDDDDDETHHCPTAIISSYDSTADSISISSCGIEIFVERR